MARSGVRVDEVIHAPGLAVGEVHDRLLAAVSADGDYQAVQVGSDRFQFARTFRPTWAIVTACITVWIALIGIVFLLVKTTETCLAVVESDHRGTRVRLQGRISSAALGRVRAAMAGESVGGMAGSVESPRPLPGAQVTTGQAGVVGAPVASTYPEVEQAPAPNLYPPVPVAPQGQPLAHQMPPPGPSGGPLPAPPSRPASPGLQTPPPLPARLSVPGEHTPPAPSGVAQPVVEQHDRSTLTPDQLGSRGPTGLNDSAVHIPAPPGEASGPTPAAPQPSGAEASNARSTEHDAGNAPCPHMVLDDGRRIDLSELTLIGRDPAPNDGEQAALVAVEDETRSVSKTHLALQFNGGGWSVVDRNSTNGVTIIGSDGTEVNLTAGVPAPVADGTIVRFGERELHLVNSGGVRPGVGA